VFADGLSPGAIAAAEAWVAEAWRDMANALIPFIEKLIADEAHEPASVRQQRFRAGLYAYTERDDGVASKPAAPDAASTSAVPNMPALRRPRAKKTSDAAVARPARAAKPPTT
jgi:hypothetical protein